MPMTPQPARALWRFYTVPGDPSNPYENEAMRAAAKTWGGDFYKNGRRRRGVGRHGLRSRNQPGLRRHRQRRTMGRRSSAAPSTWTISTPAPSSPSISPPASSSGTIRPCPTTTGTYDSVQQLMLLDLTINGTPRARSSCRPRKNGFFYVLDRVTGEFISAAAFREGQLGERLRRERAVRMVNPEAFYDEDDGDHDLPHRRRRPQLVADVVQSRDRSGLHPGVLHAVSVCDDAGTEARDQRLPAALGRRAPSENVDGPGCPERREWRAPGMGSRKPETGLARGWRRRHRRRHGDHGREPGFSGDQRRHVPRIQRRQGREAFRGADGSHRHGAAYNVRGRRQAVRRLHGWFGPPCHCARSTRTIRSSFRRCCSCLRSTASRSFRNPRPCRPDARPRRNRPTERISREESAQLSVGFVSKWSITITCSGRFPAFSFSPSWLSIASKIV